MAQECPHCERDSLALHARVIGQDEAVEAVSEAILRNRSGLSRENALVRIDMSK